MTSLHPPKSLPPPSRYHRRSGLRLYAPSPTSASKQWSARIGRHQTTSSLSAGQALANLINLLFERKEPSASIWTDVAYAISDRGWHDINLRWSLLASSDLPLPTYARDTFTEFATSSPKMCPRPSSSYPYPLQ